MTAEQIELEIEMLEDDIAGYESHLRTTQDDIQDAYDRIYDLQEELDALAREQQED